MFLTAYLRSTLAKYFLFHTAANWGSERDKVHLIELLRIPFPLPGNEFISPEAGQIVKRVAKRIRQLHDKLDKTYTRLKVDVKRQFLFDEDEKEIKKRLQQEW